MAKATWLPGYPIAYTETGDKTQQALLKGVSLETQKIYGHLNNLRQNLSATSVISIKGFVTSINELPKTSTVGLLYAVGPELYVWTGEEWRRMFLKAAQKATDKVSGVVQLGTPESMLSIVPSNTAVVTEEMLNRYNTSQVRGLPSGAILMWSQESLPDGWVYCDGTNGTPDLRNRFIRGGTRETQGMTGGADTTEFDSVGILEHTHDFAASTNVAGHLHAFTGTSTTTITGHTHTGSVWINLEAAGDHNHESPSASEVLYASRTIDASIGGGYTDTGPEYDVGQETGVSGNHNHTTAPTVTVLQNSPSHAHNMIAFTGDAVSGIRTKEETTAEPSDTGAKAVVNNVPKYKGLTFIMKL
jgi:hypothetical protein